jgi:hypothetical protein
MIEQATRIDERETLVGRVVERTRDGYRVLVTSQDGQRFHGYGVASGQYIRHAMETWDFVHSPDQDVPEELRREAEEWTEQVNRSKREQQERESGIKFQTKMKQVEAGIGEYTVKTVEFKKEFKNKFGTMYDFVVTMEDGTSGEYTGKSRENGEKFFPVGVARHYAAEPVSKGPHGWKFRPAKTDEIQSAKASAPAMPPAPVPSSHAPISFAPIPARTGIDPAIAAAALHASIALVNGGRLEMNKIEASTAKFIAILQRVTQQPETTTQQPESK